MSTAVPIYTPSDETVDAVVAGSIDWSFLRGLLPTIDPREAARAFLRHGIAGLIAYLRAEAAKTPNPLDDLAIKYLEQAVEAAIANWLGLPQPTPMQAGADDAEVSAAVGTSRKRIEDFIRARGGDPKKFNPLVIQVLLTLAWPIVEKLLERWLKN